MKTTFPGNIRKYSASLKTSFKLDNIKKIKTIMDLNFLRMRQKNFDSLYPFHFSRTLPLMHTAQWLCFMFTVLESSIRLLFQSFNGPNAV